MFLEKRFQKINKFDCSDKHYKVACTDNNW